MRKLKKYIRNSGQGWTKEDVSNLAKYIKENTPTRVIGLKLGRSVSAIRSKAKSLELSLKPYNRSPYSSNRI